MKYVLATLFALATSPVLADDGGMRDFLNREAGVVSVQAPVRLARGKSAGYDASHIVTAAAIRNGVDPRLLHAVVRVESGGRCHAHNPSGASGLGQVLPRTARSVGVVGNLHDCHTGAEAAARYLRLAVARGGSGCAGVSLYNTGVYARPRCTGYGRKVMAHL